jgi:nucleoside-diphosphate-sugar epimerase
VKINAKTPRWRRFFRARVEGKPITLTETTAQSSFRTGQRDFVYVKEVAEAFRRALESPKTGKGEIINIGTGKVVTMEDIAKAIGGEVVFIPKRGFEVERHQADITRAKALLDWTPKKDVLQWLREFVPTLGPKKEALK